MPARLSPLTWLRFFWMVGLVGIFGACAPAVLGSSPAAVRSATTARRASSAANFAAKAWL